MTKNIFFPASGVNQYDIYYQTDYTKDHIHVVGALREAVKVADNMTGISGRYIIQNSKNIYDNFCKGFTVEDDTDEFIENIKGIQNKGVTE